MGNNDLVTLQTYTNAVQAQLDSHKLSNAGIYNRIADDHMSSLVGGGLIQVRLLVKKVNLNEAIEVLFPDSGLEREVFGGPELE